MSIWYLIVFIVAAIFFDARALAQNQLDPVSIQKMTEADLEQQFRALPAGDLPQGVYRLKVLREVKGSQLARQLGDVLWSTRVFDLHRGLMRNRTAAGYRMPATYRCMTGRTDLLRDAIVIDYQSKDAAGWDALPGPEGLALWEELKMIRSGFYLGRVWSAGYPVLFYMATKESAESSVNSGRSDADDSLASARSREQSRSMHVCPYQNQVN